MSEPLLVIVTGPPATGKTTIARELATRTQLPLLEKDAIKELLFATIGAGDRERSREIGGAAFELLFDLTARLLRAGTSLMLEANFWADTAEPRLGGLPPCRVFQLYLTAPRALVQERYEARATSPERDPGHADTEAVLEVEQGLATSRWRALALPGTLVVRSTDRRVDVEEIAALVRAELDA